MTATATTTAGLAGKIRASTESETFDLAGMNATTIEQVVTDAFGTPFITTLPSSDVAMVRLTLIVGAGKLGRQKYDGQATKVVTSTLSKLGYAEDRAASAVVDCAGSYKTQHDTGKNLRTVVVFPRMIAEASDRGKGGGTKGPEEEEAAAILDPTGMAHKVAISSLATFENMLKFQCPTWSEKRTLLHGVLQDQIDVPFQDCERLLLSGTPLSQAQEEFYNSVCVAIEDKKTLVKDAMHRQIFEEMELTAEEMEYLLEHVQDRIDELKDGSGRQSSSEEEEQALQKAMDRKQKLQTVQKAYTPRSLPPLKHHAALGKLWQQAAPLMHLHFQSSSSSSSSTLLSPADTKKLGQVQEILQSIDDLETSSRGWFEDDDVFQRRIQTSRREFQVKYKGLGTTAGPGGAKNKSSGGKMAGALSKRSGGGSGGSAINANTRIQLPTSTAWMSAADKKASALKTKKNRMQKGDVFGAMMMAESSSDEEEGDFDEEDDDDNDDGDDGDVAGVNDDEKEQPSSDNAMPSQIPPDASNTANGAPKKKKNKKRKKNGSKKNDSKDAHADDRALDAAVRENRAAAMATAATKIKKEVDSTNNVLVAVVVFVRDYLLPFLAALLAWLIGAMFGKSKKAGSTRGNKSKTP